MSQVSYGTITITDTTDIEDVFLIYKGSSSNTVAPSIVWSGSTNDWKTDITQITDDYIWAITVFKRTGITITSTNYTDYYSDPVCLTGEPGASINVTSIKYSTVYTQTQPNDSTFTATNPPDVPEGGWLWSRTLFSNGQSMYSKAKQGKSPIVSKTGNTVTIVGADGNTVTVTDGTNGQSYYTYVRYSANSDGSNMVTTPTSSTKYIGVYSGTSSTVPAYTSFTWSKYVGENGSPGGTGPQGVSVISVRELYYLTAGTAPSKPTSSTTIYDDDRVGAWTSVVPAYITNGKYYVSLETTLSNSTKVFSDVILDQALTDANYNAYLAQSLSQNANENANGAMSQAIEAQYQTEALAAKVKHYWWDETGAHIASGINGADVTEGTVSTYGFNSLVGLASMTFGYNSYKTVELDGSVPALKFYKPSKTAQGALTATLNSNGLVLSEGGIEAGTKNTTNYIYVYSKDDSNHSITINNSGNKTDWRIIAGNKFGVDKAGNLYASSATISGVITVNSGSNVYTKTEADSEFDANGAAATAQANAISAAATDATNKANAAQSAAEATAAADATSKANAAETNAKGYTDTKTADMATNTTVASTYATKTTAIYRSQRIYYRKTNSGAPSKNTTWLTSSGTGYGNWSLSIPQLTSGTTKYPYLYTAVQTQTVTQYNSSATTNNCSCSDVLLDDTTTIIDGGSIIAGSVTANEITGSTLSAIYADLGAITAGSISRGNNSINFNQDAATLEFKNASTWTNATRGIQWTGSDLNIKGNITATSLTISSGASVSGVVVPNDISDMATQSYVTSQGYQTQSQVDTRINNNINVINAAKTATTYITDIDSNKGITIKPATSTGNDYLQINSTAIEFFRNSTTNSVMSLTDSVFRIGLAASNHTTVDSNGLHVWSGIESTATNELALFGTTARIGKTNNSRFVIDTTKLQAYNSSNKLYFEVSSSGIKYGTDISSSSTTNTVATTGNVSAAQQAAETVAQEYANTAEANASYSVEIQVIAIDYVNNSATLVAIPYYQGGSIPNGVTITYQWYKNGTALSNTSTVPTISGATTNTLILGEGTDFGSSSTNAIYTCVIS